MGIKVRLFGLLEQISLDDLVPQDRFTRQVAVTLDLTYDAHQDQ